MVDKKQINRNEGHSLSSQLPDGLRRRASVFVQRNKQRIKKEGEFKRSLLLKRNTINVGFDYKDQEIILNTVKELLLFFGFVNEERVLEGMAIKQKNTILTTGLVTGRLKEIQLRPFKNKIALVLFVKKKIDKKTKKLKDFIDIDLKIACEEDELNQIIEGRVWSGSENGLTAGNKADNLKEEDAFSGVSGGIARKRHGI